jgi:hypothetical protein
MRQNYFADFYSANSSPYAEVATLQASLPVGSAPSDSVHPHAGWVDLWEPSFLGTTGNATAEDVQANINNIVLPPLAYSIDSIFDLETTTAANPPVSPPSTSTITPPPVQPTQLWLPLSQSLIVPTSSHHLSLPITRPIPTLPPQAAITGSHSTSISPDDVERDDNFTGSNGASSTTSDKSQSLTGYLLPPIKSKCGVVGCNVILCAESNEDRQFVAHHWAAAHDPIKNTRLTITTCTWDGCKSGVGRTAWTGDRRRLVPHLYTHIMVSCRHCGSSFKTTYSLNRHIKTTVKCAAARRYVELHISSSKERNVPREECISQLSKLSRLRAKSG